MKNISLAKIAILALFLLFTVGITAASLLGIEPSFEAILNLRNEAPTADFTFSPNNICANEPIKFTNTSTGTDLTYSWNFGDGTPLSTLKDPTHTFNAVGGGTKIFTVTLTVTENGVASTPVSKQVAIKEIPSLNVTSDMSNTDFDNLKYFIVCENKPSEFTFYNAAGPTEKNILYQIDWGDGSPAFSGATWTELKHTYAVGIYTITYTVTSENACKVSKKYGVFIGSNPAVGLGNPGNTNVCVGETLTFPITGTANNPPGTKYTVTFSDGSAPQVFNHPAPASVSHTFTKTSCGSTADGFENSFSVKIVAENPCSRSQASVVPIYVSEPPTPKIKAPGDPVCVDTNVTFENTTQFGTEVSNNGTCSQEGKFVWEITPATGWTLQGGSSLGTRPNPTAPNTWISGTKNLVPRFTTPGTYTIKLITGNKCGIKEEVKTICVIPKPIASFTLEKTEVCGPATVKATNTSNILGACGTLNSNTFTWSVSYSNGACGTSSDWKFTGGSNQNSQNPSFLFEKPGIYTVRLIIAASCGSVSKEEKITVTAPPTVTINDIPNSCGPVTITPKATIGICDSGTPVYKWTFEGGVPATSSSLDPGPVTFSTPGPKKITLEVTSSCGSTKTEKVFTVNELPVANAGPDAEICNGEEIKLIGTASGGTGPYTYQWTSLPTSTIVGANTATPTVKPNQTTVYKLTVSDQATNCISTDEVQIKVIPAPIIQFDIPNQEICSGEITKAVNLTTIPSGETITWTSIANGAAGVTPTGTVQIPAQTLINTTGKPIDVVYTAVIANATQGNCTVVPAKYTIRVNPAPVYTSENRSICSDQSFDFKPANNVTGSTFTWTVLSPTGISGASNSTLPATSIKQQLKNTTNAPLDAIYTITPFLGTCPGNPFELKVTVQPAPSLIFSETDQTLCTGTSSKAVLFSSDVAGATFSWTVNPKGITGGVVISGTGNQLPAQNLINATNQPITLEYQIIVSTNTGGTCSGVPKTYRITVNPPINLTAELSNFNGFGVSCSGSNDGFIKLNPSGGNGIFIYSWIGPDGFTSSSKDLSNLKPGSYQVTVSDQFGCSFPKTYQITEPQPVVANNENLSICSNQSFDFKPANLLTGSTFTWSVVAPVGISGASNSILPATSIKQQLITTSNEPRDVIYTVTPFFGACSGNPFELKVTVQPAPSITFSETDQTLCTGTSSKAVLFSSDVAGATFSWTVNPKGITGGVVISGTGNQLPSQNLINPTNQPITLEYQISVSTSSGGTCSGVPKIYRITVNPSISLTDEVSKFNGFGISCSGANDGFIKLNPTGGNGIFTYSWTGPAGFTSSSKDLSNLKPGSYQVSISDQFGCSFSKTYQITEPQPLVANVVSVKNILCAGDESGAIEISVSGGTSSLPFKFEWKRNGISIPANSQNLSGIPAGTYDVKIIDANGCFKTLSGIQLTEPAAALVINYKKTDISCFGANDGALDLAVSGGQPPYIITWTFGSSQRSFDNLGPGNYTLTVADQSGCTRTQTITINDAPLFETIPEVKQISCFGKKDGSIKLNLNGGVGKTTIRWDHGAELENLFNLSSGFYGVTVRDETDCVIRSEFNIVEPAQLQLDPKVTDALDCFNTQSGEINLGIIGGTPPYTIQWSNGSTSETLTGITSGQYAVTVKDASGCSINQSFEIKRPPVLNIVGFRSTNVQCNPRSIEEKFQVTVTGGVAPYTIQWSGGKVSTDGKIMTTESPGLYEVIVTDGKGCVKKESFEVESLEVIPRSEIESAAFEQYNSYLVNFEIQFLNKSFGQITSYFWDFGDGSESFEENPKHTYTAEGEYEITLKVTDIFGCASEVKKKISVFDYYLVVPNVFTPNGDGINDYFFPKFINIESLEFWVLNKWGETVFYTDELNSQGWDGKINQVIGLPGNYVYKLKFKTLDGRTQTSTDLFMLLK